MSTPTDQPRQPAGSPQGGQFATNPGGEEGPDLTGDSRFGPNTVAVQAIIDRAKTLTPVEMERMYAAAGAVRFAALDDAGDVASYAARDRDWPTVWDAAARAVGAEHVGVAAVVGETALAELVRDLISEDHYNLLMTPWRAVVRPV